MVSRTHTPKKKQNTGKDPKGDVYMESGQQPNDIRNYCLKSSQNLAIWAKSSTTGLSSSSEVTCICLDHDEAYWF